MAGWSTRSSLTTRRSGVSEPACSDEAERPTTYPSTSCPAKRTFTRTPGCAAAAIEAGTA